MGIRSSLTKLILLILAIAASFYTVNVYMDVIAKWNRKNFETSEGKIHVKDMPPTDELVPVAPKLPEIAVPKYACDMRKQCDENKEIPFQIVSGAANIIGPSICVNGKWLMSNSIGNVNRGMNVATVSGKTGERSKVEVFDLYGQESGPFKEYLKNLPQEEIVFMATFDDATQRLDKETRVALTELGSENAEKLAFRDNWIFVGGKSLKHHTDLERHVVSDKAINKFGNWPGTVTLEGCIPKLT